MLRKIFYIILILFHTNTLFAMNYYSFDYEVEDRETFAQVLKKFVKDDSIINANTPMVKKIIKMNPEVKDWRILLAGKTIVLYISDDFMDLKKYKEFIKDKKEKIVKNRDNINLQLYPEGFKRSVFYMASIGKFVQRASDVAEINYNESSPVTFGFAGTYYLKDKKYSIASSIYYSALMESKNNLTSDLVKLPPEKGATIYGEKRLNDFNLTAYAGLDYENFSLFNIQGVVNDKKVYVDNVNAIYLTVGGSKLVNIFKVPIFFKVSMSRSAITSFSSTYSNTSSSSVGFEDAGKYSGYKFLLYSSYKISNKFYVQSLFKYHLMNGPSDLSIFRIGVGLGFIF